MSVESIALWHKRARPKPTHDDLRVQIGCHLEEVVEMLDALDFSDNWEYLIDELEILSYHLKEGNIDVTIRDKVELLDALADQIVTAVGVGVCANMDVVGGVDEVNLSNWSKFDQFGNPVFNEHGKIAKSEFYRKPELRKFIEK
jgi:hypothetical protein